MIHWFRSHHGAPFDSKLAVVAKRANVTRGHAASVWWAVLDHASQQNERGFVGEIDAEEIAAAFDYEQADVERILAAMRQNELLIGSDGMLVGWNKRQVSREDETALSRKRKQRSRNVTQCHAETENVPPRLEKTRVDKKDISIKSDFEVWWESYPRKAGKAHARKEFKIARTKTDLQTLIAGAKRYAASRANEDAKFTAHPATWLNGERWTDDLTDVGLKSDAQVERERAETDAHQAIIKRSEEVAARKAHERLLEAARIAQDARNGVECPETLGGTGTRTTEEITGNR